MSHACCQILNTTGVNKQNFVFSKNHLQTLSSNAYTNKKLTSPTKAKRDHGFLHLIQVDAKTSRLNFNGNASGTSEPP